MARMLDGATDDDRNHDAETCDEYLGFAIRSGMRGYIARPRGWKGDALEGRSLPETRRRIWLWWHDEGTTCTC